MFTQFLYGVFRPQDCLVSGNVNNRITITLPYALVSNCSFEVKVYRPIQSCCVIYLQEKNKIKCQVFRCLCTEAVK